MTTKFNFVFISFLVISTGCLSNNNANSQEIKEKLRVIISSDFPPIGVVKSGLFVPKNKKSDPDDMQSMVRFLLYANEFDVEGLVASAGTFAMIADKNNILGSDFIP